MSYRVGGPEWIFALDVDAGARLLLLRLWGFADGDVARAACRGEGDSLPFVWPCRARLAADLACTDRAIRRQLAALREAGAIEPEVRVIGGRPMHGFVLRATPPAANVRPATGLDDGPSPLHGPDASDRATGRSEPPARTLAAKTADASDRLITPVITPEDHERGRVAPAPPEPLALDLGIADVLDIDAVIVAVVDATVAARKALGSRARRSITEADGATVRSLAKLGPLVEVAGGVVVDVRTTAGLISAWRTVVDRKLEELRRRASRSRTDPAGLAHWLKLANLKRDAQGLLVDGVDLDTPQARAAPVGPPSNPTDLTAYANTGDLLP